ncbi:MAG: DinB family protein [Caldilineaceae bacterium]|nr:DinB family protein [Caldilineaceae bacterium]
MTIDYGSIVWKQYGAAIDMLEDAIRLCPDHLWRAALWKDSDDARFGELWFVAYHTLFWSDLYLTGRSEGFSPPPPFVRGRLPDQSYSKDQILSYLSECRKKCQATLEGLTEERAQQKCVFEWMEPSFLELQIYAMRHVQVHAGQLSLLLGQHDVTGFDWVASARESS